MDFISPISAAIAPYLAVPPRMVALLLGWGMGIAALAAGKPKASAAYGWYSTGHLQAGMIV